MPAPSNHDHHDRVAESASIWFCFVSCHALMLAALRHELESPAQPTKGKRRSQAVTLTRLDLLANLDQRDGQTLADLSRAMLVTAGNVTGLVRRAERDRVVERRPDPGDRRVVRVWLTPRGRVLVRSLLPIYAGEIHRLLCGLPNRDRRALLRTLSTLREHIQPRERRRFHKL